jgi:pimeloyl-ACP methyl ester carboxylesterase/DNA-binding XRE family transcriptional regulator
MEGSLMAQSPTSRDSTPPYWSQALRALREARGITQDGWAAQIGYGRATVRRWESGETVPSAEAENAIICLCKEKRLLRRFEHGPLAGIDVSPEWIADLLSAARLRPDAPPRPAAPFETPPVRYASSGDVSIAYQVFGDGPVDIVVTPGAVSHRDVDWEHHGIRAFMQDLARIGRVIVFDKRGTGMSDRVPAGTMEERMDDIRAVMEAAGSSRAILVGISEGGPLSILFAATWPERISGLVLYGTYARVPAPSPEMAQQPFEHLLHVWGTPDSGFLDRFGPSAAANPEEREWWARLQRMSASPGAVRDLNRMNATLDVRAVLPAIHVPTLVVHRTGDRVTDISHGRGLARSIPGAKLVELPGSDHLPYLGDVAAITNAITDFVTETRKAPEADRLLATVLRAVVDDASDSAAFREIVRRELARWRGREVSDPGNGLLATFDGPTRAVRCACAIRDRAREHALAPRTGIHTGEIEVRNSHIAGRTVDVCRALSERAQPAEVLVSGTVTALMSDPGGTFTIDGAGTVNGALRDLRIFRIDAPVT